MTTALKIIGILIAVVVVVLFGLWLKLRGPDIPNAVLEAKYANAQSHFVDLPGGVRLHYRDEGNPAGPVLVLLHGYGDSFTSWDHWVEILGADFRILRLDFPGHGLTQSPSDYPVSGAGFADLVDAFAAQLSLPKFAVAGNSMGGGVAWNLAVRHPDRLSALVLVDAAGWPSEHPPKDIPLAFKILQYRLGRALLATIDNRPLIEEGLKLDVYDKSIITPAFIDRWAEFQRAPGHRTILMSVNPGAHANATPEGLAGIKVPTLILHGESDVLIDVASARKFAAAIPGSQLIVYPQVGHLPQIEIPAKSAGDVSAFLKSLPQ